LRQQRQAALGDEIDTVGRRGFFDRRHHVIEPHSKVWIVPSNQRAFEFSQQESKIFLDHVEVQRLIRYYRVNAEAAGIRAPEASDHRDHFYEWGFSKGRFDKLPALSNSR